MTLDEYLRSWSPDEFDWAEANCVHFVAGWVRASTGVDPMLGIPSLESPLQWKRWVRSEGGLRQAVSRHLGWQPRAPAFVQRNDIIITEGTSTGWAFGLCTGRLMACLDSSGKVVLLDAPVDAAWAYEKT